MSERARPQPYHNRLEHIQPISNVRCPVHTLHNLAGNIAAEFAAFDFKKSVVLVFMTIATVTYIQVSLMQEVSVAGDLLLL